MAALPEAPPTPMMVPPIAPPPSSHVAHSSQKRLSAAKKHKHEHKVASKSGKSVKVAKHSKKKKKNHTKVAKASKQQAPTSTKLASRTKPAAAAVPLELAGAGNAGGADDSGPECADAGRALIARVCRDGCGARRTRSRAGSAQMLQILSNKVAIDVASVGVADPSRHRTGQRDRVERAPRCCAPDRCTGSSRS